MSSIRTQHRCTNLFEYRKKLLELLRLLLKSLLHSVQRLSLVRSHLLASGLLRCNCAVDSRVEGHQGVEEFGGNMSSRGDRRGDN